MCACFRVQPTLWFIDLTVATCHIQYPFLNLCHFFLNEKTDKRWKYLKSNHHFHMIQTWPPTVTRRAIKHLKYSERTSLNMPESCFKYISNTVFMHAVQIRYPYKYCRLCVVEYDTLITYIFEDAICTDIVYSVWMCIYRTFNLRGVKGFFLSPQMPLPHNTP